MRTPARTSGNRTSVVALDLGANAVRVVEVEWSGPGLEGRVTRRGSAPLQAAIWNNLGQHVESLSGAIQQALSTAGITSRTVVACLPRRLVTLRVVRLPHAPPEQLRGMVAFEAQQVLLFPLDEVVLDYNLLAQASSGVGEDELDTILIAAARRTLVGDIMAAFDRAGLELSRLSVSALALAENVRDALEPTALVDMEPGEMDVAVVASGELLFTRASLLEVQTLPAEVAERRALEEAARSFTAYQNEFRARPIQHVRVCGSGLPLLPAGSLETALSGLLEMPVTPLQTALIPATDADLRHYATAIGLAAQTRPDAIASVNLVPTERAERKAALARGTRNRLALLALGAAAVIGIVLVQGSLKSGAAQQEAVVRANNDYNTAKDRLSAQQKTYDRTHTVATELLNGLDRNHPAVDVLVALNAAMPTTTDIWLTQFSFERGGLLTVRGETKTASAATDLVIALQNSGAFTDVRLGYLGDAQDTENGGNGGSTVPVTPNATGARTNGAAVGTGTPRTGAPAANPANGAGANPAPLPGMAAPNGGGANGGRAGRRRGAQARSDVGNARGVRLMGRARDNGDIPGGGQEQIQLAPNFTPGQPLPGFQPGQPPPGVTTIQVSPGQFPGGFPGGPPPGAAPGVPANVSAPPPSGGTPNGGGRGGPVPNITLPPGTNPTPTLPNAARPAPNNGTPGQASAGGPRPTLTSFVITCRVNSRSRNLVPAHIAPVANRTTGSSKTTARTNTKTNNTADTGDDDADTQ